MAETNKIIPVKGKGPVFDPGLCRCCGTMKKCRVLNVEYESFGQKEIYSDMIMDCYGLLLSHLDAKASERLICATCVTRLREAFSFRKQVLQCEEAFIQMRIYDMEYEERQARLGDGPPAGARLEEALVEGQPKIEVEVVKMEPVEYNNDAPSPQDTLADDGHDYDDLKPATAEDWSAEDTAPLKERKLKPHRIKKVKMKAKPSKEDLAKPALPRRVAVQQPPLPMSKVQQLIRERDPTYTTETNVLTVVEYSYVCPFKCRHNHLHCYYCSQNFDDPEQLRIHTAKEHHPKKFKIIEHKNMIKVDLTRIDCRLCDEKINNLEDFKQHITSVHNKKYYFNCKDSLLPFRLTKNQSQCALCDAIFPYFHALNKHMNVHYRNFVCETCGLGFVDKGRFLMHQQRHDEGDFPCETCGKIFKAQYNRDLHIDRVHKKRGRVYCPKCDIKLMSYPQKLKHLVEVHGEAPMSFPCNQCDKVYETRRMLTLHRRKDHLKDYRYECQCCGQKFFTRFALNNHMPTHTGERNFKCKVCEKCYPRLKTLKDHMRIHSNDRRYRCHVCAQAFVQNCSLKGHIKSQHPEYG